MESVSTSAILEPSLYRRQSAFTGLRDLSRDNPRAFIAAALQLIAGPKSTPGRQYVISLLISRGLAPPCDPAVASLDDEIAIARAVAQQDPQFGRRFSDQLKDCLETSPRDAKRAERMLGIAAEVCPADQLAPALELLRQDPDVRLKSKAVLLYARARRDPAMVASLLDDPSARVRANAVEALWGVDSAEARAVLERALSDPHNRVVGNALLGLLRLTDAAAVDRVRALATSEDARLRATAAWVMGASGLQSFREDLTRMIRDLDVRVRHSVFRAIARLRTESTTGPDRTGAGVPL